MEQPVIIFVCEHGAAKSIVAAAYFNQFIQETGLNLQAIARGTNPDTTLLPEAIQGLAKDGLTPGEATPQKLTPADIQSAQRMIAFCELPVEYQGQVIVERWDVPPVSENYEVARDAIIQHIRYFVSQIK
jgi:protein-tyrosine-phosphatase